MQSIAINDNITLWTSIICMIPVFFRRVSLHKALVMTDIKMLRKQCSQSLFMNCLQTAYKETFFLNFGFRRAVTFYYLERKCEKTLYFFFLECVWMIFLSELYVLYTRIAHFSFVGPSSPLIYIALLLYSRLLLVFLPPLRSHSLIFFSHV